MNPTERTAKIYECRGQLLVTLSRYDIDIGVEAMISLLAGACAAVEPRRQQPLLAQVTKEIRSQYKGVARVQQQKASEARRNSRISEDNDQASVGGGGPPSEPVERVQFDPPGND